MRPGIPSISPPRVKSDSGCSLVDHPLNQLSRPRALFSILFPPMPAPVTKRATGPHYSMLTERNQSIWTHINAGLCKTQLGQQTSVILKPSSENMVVMIDIIVLNISALSLLVRPTVLNRGNSTPTSPPKRHLAMSGDILYCPSWRWALLVPGR